jgi:hypothetical protein
LSSEDLLAVIWSSGTMHYGLGMGYGLVITSTRVIGAKKTPWVSGFQRYLGPGSQTTESDIKKAREVAARLESEKDFELPKESIIRITYLAPGMVSGGHILFKTIQGDVELRLAAQTPDVGVARTVKQLIPALAAFASDRFYDEKTGARITPG